ncbi:NAD(+) synthase [Cesiribacter andamanensis]|uniref:Glutamine-dependent NAD(+) synthetase n=1 Tax=Cesiribacter andamanensis AMV16 TaxID=1279009 RepID=M7N6Z9_9BACT|nr:NAD(+) synthase [Cesiribacter andamanensis]EMR03052.1 Glutamine-dependent NAD(+) synthetase [Cesiribacter andamanensis AMV16]
MTYLRLGAASLNTTPFDWAANLRNIRLAIEEAREKGVQLLLLPEMCLTGYGCEDVFLTEWLPTKALQLLEEVKGWCSNITVALGVPYRYQGDLYNGACLIHDGRILGITAKQWLANDGVHYETRWFSPWPAGRQETVELHGESFPFGDVVYELHGIKIAFEICEDAWRTTSRPAIRHHEKDVDLILNPSASHFAMCKTELRKELVCTSSALYACTYVYANLLGNEAGRMIYDGDCFITHHGELVQRSCRLSFKEVDMIWADVDFANRRFTPQPIKQDALDKETEFAKAASLALFDYMRKSRSRGFVLSLSGGADSSTCAVLVSEMVKRGCAELGTKRFLERAGFGALAEELAQQELQGRAAERYIVSKLLVCAYQGTKHSSDDTFASAQQLAQDVGATFYHWTIDEEVRSYTGKIEQAIGRKLAWQSDDIALQNIQARARSPIIWMLANLNNALLLTTSNRSEADVGYATMDGDTSGSISPIAGVDKEFVRHWLRWAQQALDYPGLAPVNGLSPSAELRPLEQTQTDEEDLMPYAILVAIERLAIRDRYSPKQTLHLLQLQELAPADKLKGWVIKFFRLWSRNQWKRERYAPAFHLDDFNVDPRSWCRFPILSGGYAEELKELEGEWIIGPPSSWKSS